MSCKYFDYGMCKNPNLYTHEGVCDGEDFCMYFVREEEYKLVDKNITEWLENNVASIKYYTDEDIVTHLDISEGVIAAIKQEIRNNNE